MSGNGQPLKFKTVKELEDKIQEYFDSCFEEQWVDEDVRDEDGNKAYVRVPLMPIAKGGYAGSDVIPSIKHYKKKVLIKIPVVSGLAYFLGTSRRTLLNYEEKDDYFHTIKEAKQFIEYCTEEGMINGKINPTAAIFNMKNNWGWKDEIHNTVTDTRLTPEEKAKMDTLLLNKKDDGNKSESIKTGDSGNKGAA